MNLQNMIDLVSGQTICVTMTKKSDSLNWSVTTIRDSFFDFDSAPILSILSRSDRSCVNLNILNISNIQQKDENGEKTIVVNTDDLTFEIEKVV